VWLFHDASWQQHFRLCILAFDTAHREKNGTGILASYFFDVYMCRDSKLTWLFIPFQPLYTNEKCFLTNITYDTRFARSNFYLCRLHNANGFAFSTAIK
jgi:hypothetical protein